jgi:hypothetical protein
LERPLTAELVDRAVPRGRDDPRRRVSGDAVTGPALESAGKCVLDRVLGQIEIAEDADEDRDRTAPFLSERFGDRVYAALSAPL